MINKDTNFNIPDKFIDIINNLANQLHYDSPNLNPHQISELLASFYYKVEQDTRNNAKRVVVSGSDVIPNINIHDVRHSIKPIELHRLENPSNPNQFSCKFPVDITKDSVGKPLPVTVNFGSLVVGTAVVKENGLTELILNNETANWVYGKHKNISFSTSGMLGQDGLLDLKEISLIPNPSNKEVDYPTVSNFPPTDNM